MAVSYKGLVIQFGGDTTELQGALRKVSTESKKTQSDLKEINRSLKFNPGNTELLEQKVRTLNKAYGETKQKLDAYKQALSQLEEKKKRGEQLTEEEQRQYDSLKRSILQCENQLESYGNELQETSKEAEASKTKLYQLGQTLEDNADELGSVGEKMETAGKTATAVFGGMATAAVAAFGQVEDAENIAVNGAGAMGEAAQEIRRSVREVAASAPGDLVSVGKAVGDVNTHFQVTGSRLDTISGAFLRFSKISGGDVSKSIENVAMSMKAFNVDADQTELVLDHIASTSTATGVSVDTLTADLNANGATFRKMGLSLQDSVTLMGSFEAAGIPASGMLTGLKKAAAACTKDGTDMGTMLGRLTKELQNPATKAKATKEAIELFGSKAATSFVDAAESGRLNLGDLGGSLDEAKGFVNGLCDETMSSSDKIEESLKDITLAGAELGEEFAPVIDDAVGMLKEFTGWVKTLTPEQKQLFAGIVTGGLAFGGLSIGIGKTLQSAATIGSTFKSMAGGITTLTSGANGLSKAFSGGLAGGWKSFTGMIAAHPIALGIAAVAAAVAGLTWFFTQTEDGKKMWADFTSYLTEKWQGVSEWLSGVGDFWGGVWKDASDGVKGFCDDTAKKWDGLKKGASNCFGAISKTVQMDMATAKKFGGSASSALKAALSGDWTKAKADAASAFGAIKENISAKLNVAQQGAVKVADMIGAKLGFPGLGEKVKGVFDGIRRFMENPIKTAWEYISGIPGRIASAFGGINISLPHVNLPHFNVQWQDIGGVIKLPAVSIDWYAKGGYFDKASIIGVGERGGEFVAPERQLWDFIERAVNNAFGGSGGGQTIAVSVEVNATVAGGMDAYETGRQIGNGIASKLKQRGVEFAL